MKLKLLVNNLRARGVNLGSGIKPESDRSNLSHLFFLLFFYMTFSSWEHNRNHIVFEDNSKFKEGNFNSVSNWIASQIQLWHTSHSHLSPLIYYSFLYILRGVWSEWSISLVHIFHSYCKNIKANWIHIYKYKIT